MKHNGGIRGKRGKERKTKKERTAYNASPNSLAWLFPESIVAYEEIGRREERRKRKGERKEA